MIPVLLVLGGMSLGFVFGLLEAVCFAAPAPARDWDDAPAPPPSPRPRIATVRLTEGHLREALAVWRWNPALQQLEVTRYAVSARVSDVIDELTSAATSFADEDDAERGAYGL